MNFENLITRYSVPFEIIQTTGGKYVAGEYVADYAEARWARGAIVSIPRKKVYQSGGHLTTKDLRLYTLRPVADSLNGLKVRYRGETYSVEEDGDYSLFAGVNSYVLKWVDGFDRSETNDG